VIADISIAGGTCADPPGGCVHSSARPPLTLSWSPPPPQAPLRIRVRGLMGGHSGVDIHEDRVGRTMIYT
jgi:hypothetical protein